MTIDQQFVHFKHDLIGHEPLLFKNAIDFVKAETLDDVKIALNKIEDYSKKGYYAVGYVAYEAYGAFIPYLKSTYEPTIPYVYFGIYEKKRVSSVKEYESNKKLNFTPNTSFFNYKQSIHQIHDAIENDEVKQVNYTIRLHAVDEEVSSEALFFNLLQSQQCNYSAHLQFDDFEILSISPELFFATDGKRIETRPMKGTIKRGKSFEEDLFKKNELKHSKKDIKENEMIVKLVENELKSIAKEGTTSISERYRIEKYPTVYQMTSTVNAQLREDVTLLSIFESLFPSASITGTPKQMAIEMINQLEDTPRNIYCGAIGIVSPGGHALFNVPIRTILFNRNNDEWTYGVGGGITIQSTAKGEYEEVLAKSDVLNYKLPNFDLLETMKMERGEIVLLDEHLNRLKESSEYFNRPFIEKDARQQLNELTKKYRDEVYKVRLLLNKKGGMTLEVTKENSELEGVQKIVLAERPIKRDNIFLYHKTTHRTMYDDLRNDRYYDTLLWNEEGYITEFTYGNIVFEQNQKLFTPPVKDGLLRGTFREKLLNNGTISECSLHKNDLFHIEKLWLINSVRGWVEVVIEK